MAKNLVIVESPAKAKTIEKYLGKDFKVLASYGHVRDLVKGDGAVDPEHDFTMHYAVSEKSEKHVDRIVREAKKADALYLATDLDREGEAISWHVHEILKDRGVLNGIDVHRVVFSEITKRAIQAAVDSPRELSMDLINAQQARRALDRLVGYKLSPLLWKKIRRGLSAGRVQSPALRLIVEREQEIEKFEPREYWSVEADLEKDQQPFMARLVRLHGDKFEQFTVTDGKTAGKVREELVGAAGGRLKVDSVKRRERRRRPAPPFITSTLQQEASRKLRFSAQRTMRTAQQLYEGIEIDGVSQGLITYMRTDSVSLSMDALGELRSTIEKHYGADKLPDKFNFYRTKAKNAQEAHEAIRPTSSLRSPNQVKRFLSPDQSKLYELIWKRTAACQMKPALLNTVAVEFDCGEGNRFRANGSTVVDPGFLAVYEEGKDDSKPGDGQERRLPPLEEGDTAELKDVRADQHFTEPPPRFSEASLVKALEEFGIGRPSTYASIISTLLNRDYVELDARRFVPTDVGRIVARFLSQHFDQYVDYDFTANLEDELDAVSRGEQDWVPLMHQFWEPFAKRVKEKDESVSREDVLPRRELGTDPKSGKPVSVRMGRYGPYIQIGTREDEEKPEFAGLRPGQKMESVTLEEGLKLFQLPRELGETEEGEPVSTNIGRFGPYVKYGNKFVSLGKDDDPYTVGLERALELVRAKKERDANRIIRSFDDGRVQILRGRWGPYITDGNKNGRVPKDREPESLSLAECEKILEEAPARGSRRKKTGKKASKKTTRKASKKSARKSSRKAKKKTAKKAAGKARGKKAGSRKKSAKKAAAGKAGT